MLCSASQRSDVVCAFALPPQGVELQQMLQIRQSSRANWQCCKTGRGLTFVGLHKCLARSQTRLPQKYNQAFKKICANCTPVFQHYFFENYPDATTWYRCRLNYVRSVATTSIVGCVYYALAWSNHEPQAEICTALKSCVMPTRTDTCSALATGIRKIFCSTREAPSSFIATLESCLSKVCPHHMQLQSLVFITRVHAGLELRNPERVPFRLTRDIVAGMGYSGRSGSMLCCLGQGRCCARLELKCVSGVQVHRESFGAVARTVWKYCDNTPSRCLPFYKCLSTTLCTAGLCPPRTFYRDK